MTRYNGTENTYVEISCHAHAATRKAVLISDNGDEDNAKWVPLSQIKNASDVVVGEDNNLELAEWLAQREGFI